MSGRNALATPTNVYPRNGNVVEFSHAASSADDKFSVTFTCQSDSMAYFGLTVYDVTTGEQIRNLFSKTFNNNDPRDIYVYHRGDTVKTYMAREAFNDPAQTLYSGYHYSYKLTMYSCIPDPTGQYQNIPNCVVPYASGIILEVGDSESALVSGSRYLKIQNGIPKLREPIFWEDNDSLLGYEIIGCTYLRIGHEERMVTVYDRDSGWVTLDSPMPASALTPAINGEPLQYFLYCNFIESSGSESEGSYDFYIRDEIESTFSSRVVPVGLQCRATYDQGNNVGLESYRFKVYTETGNNYINGQVQAITSAIEDQVNPRHIPIATGITEGIDGKMIRFAKTPSATFPNDIVTDGYSAKISSYDSATGIVTLVTKLNTLPQEGTRYSIVMDDSELLADSGEVYNYHMIYNLPVYTPGQTFNVETTMTSYEKQQLTISDKVYVPMPTLPSNITGHEISADYNNQRVVIKLHGTTSSFGYHRNIYRREAGEATWKKLGILEEPTTFTDYLAGNNRDYEYAITECLDNSDSYETYDPTTNFKPYTGITLIQSPDPLSISTSWDGWTITSIYPYNRKISKSLTEILSEETAFRSTEYYVQTPYYIGETWHFVSAIDSGSITTNLGRAVHVGTSRYPTVTGSNNKYQSGTFTTNLLSIECPDETIYDNIEKVDRWQKFINDDCLFILKSDKGDVWIVAISDNTSRTYDESADPILTNVSYSWVEVDSPENIQIVSKF